MKLRFHELFWLRGFTTYITGNFVRISYLYSLSKFSLTHKEQRCIIKIEKGAATRRSAQEHSGKI